MLGACALRLAVRCCTLPVVDSQYKSPTRIGSSSPPHHKPCHCTQSKQFWASTPAARHSHPQHLVKSAAYLPMSMPSCPHRL